MTPRQRYQSDLARKQLLADPAQEVAVEYLQALYEAMLKPQPRRGLMARFTRQRPQYDKGIYLWGGVGRGKTFLMDQFYDMVPFSGKQRWHFSEFMRYIHEEIARLPLAPDPLGVISGRVASKISLLCLDEFHVDDIGDAMLLDGLLRGLACHGVTLVMTSNTAPDDLYKNGLQRSRFLPAIELIKQHNHVVSLDGEKDYRRYGSGAVGNCYPIMKESDARSCMQQYYTELSGIHPDGRQVLNINGREIHVEAWAEGVLWCDFHELCATPRAPSDYLEIAARFDTLLVTRTPMLGAAEDACAQRLIHLVDALYDKKIRFLTTLEAPLEQLYSGRRLRFNFRRTISRLYEMAAYTVPPE